MKALILSLARPKLKTSAVIVIALALIIQTAGSFAASGRKLKKTISTTTLRSMARINMATGNYEKAQPLAEQALALAKQTNADNEELALCLIDLAYLYNCTGRFDDAVKMGTLGLKLQEKTYYKKHPYIAYTLRTLSDIYRNKGQYEQAAHSLERAINIMLDSHQPDDKAMTQFYIDRGTLFHTQGNFDRAQNYYDKAQLLINEAYKESHLFNAGLMLKKSQLYLSKGQITKANQLATKAFDIQKKIYGDEHKLLAPTWLVMADIARASENYDNAEQFLQNALRAIQNKQQSDILEGRALSALAMVYMVDGRYIQAEQACSRAVEVLENSLGLKNDHTAMAMNNLARIYIQQGKLSKAEPLCDRALATLQTMFGTNHPNVTEVRRTIAQLQYRRTTSAEIASLDSSL